MEWEKVFLLAYYTFIVIWVPFQIGKDRGKVTTESAAGTIVIMFILMWLVLRV